MLARSNSLQPIRIQTPFLNELSWEEIARIASYGDANKYWAEGYEKNETLTNGHTVTFQIWAFNHDNLADGGGKAFITFGMKHLLGESAQMNADSTNVGGFSGSLLGQGIQSGNIRDLIPNDLNQVIKPVLKTTGLPHEDGLTTEIMTLFIPSITEIGFSSNDYTPGQGERYPVFTNNASRIKALDNGNGLVERWWTRSPMRSGNGFGPVTITGTLATTQRQASAFKGVCLAFCV